MLIYRFKKEACDCIIIIFDVLFLKLVYFSHREGLVMKQTQLSLNQLLADLNQMLMLTYQVHWYMRGQRFLYLHPLLDSSIAAYQKEIDTVAEQLIILGGSPYSTLQELADNTQIRLEPGDFNRSIDEQLKLLRSGIHQLELQVDKVILVAENEEVQPVIDMAGELKSYLQKELWMINAELGEDSSAS